MQKKHAFQPGAALALTALLAAPVAASAAEIRVMCYQDGVECEVTAELAKRFEAQNAGTKVIVDTVPYKTIVEQLPVQLAAGQGPDIARVTDLGGLSKYYLDIASYVKDKVLGSQLWCHAAVAAPLSHRQGHLRLHVAAHHDRPLCQQDPV
jgi:ABC-type glycerol-3-phosphate transport system substrate-binding protein